MNNSSSMDDILYSNQSQGLGSDDADFHYRTSRWEEILATPGEKSFPSVSRVITRKTRIRQFSSFSNKEFF